ncbi:MAG TPA: uL22 family ribosomal protein [Chitinophagales bacterium]|nr:uL22 family ribosomal protein [Chitinophagales bacterium]
MEAIAKLRNHPSSPRKMRLLADIVRGQEIGHAMNVLRFSYKLLRSALANWEQAHGRADENFIFISHLTVDGARSLKRIKPAPMGRAYRVSKRSNHVTVVLTAIEKIQQNLTENN